MDPNPREDSEDHDAGPEPSRENVGELLEGLRPRLRRMLTLRLHPQLKRRMDPADIVQETFAEVVRRLDEYRATPATSFFLWVRFLAVQKVAQLHQHHLGRARRDVGREVSPTALPAASTASLARVFVHPGPTPSAEASRNEILARVRAALDRLDELDREVLALRYFERLSVEETAVVLGLTLSGVNKRQVRALSHLQRELPRMEDVPTPP